MVRININRLCLAALVLDPTNLGMQSFILFRVEPLLIPVDLLAISVPASFGRRLEYEFGNVLVCWHVHASIFKVFDDGS